MRSSSRAICARARFVIGPVPIARADVGELAQEPPSFRRRHRIIGKAIAEIGHREVEPIGELAGAGDRLGQIAKKSAGHVGRRLEVPLGVGRQEAARLGDGGLVPDAGKHVEDFPLLQLGMANAVGGE